MQCPCWRVQVHFAVHFNYGRLLTAVLEKKASTDSHGVPSFSIRLTCAASLSWMPLEWWGLLATQENIRWHIYFFWIESHKSRFHFADTISIFGSVLLLSLLLLLFIQERQTMHHETDVGFSENHFSKVAKLISATAITSIIICLLFLNLLCWKH